MTPSISDATDAGGNRVHPADWGEPKTRTITWFEPSVASRLAAGLSGLEYLQGIIEGRIPPPPIAAQTGSRIVSVGEGEVVFACVPHESFLNPLGLIHGGLLCTLLDSAMGVATQTLVPAGQGYATIELKVSFLRPVPYDGRELAVHGKVLQLGRRIAFTEAQARDADGRLVGHATSSLAAVGG